MSKESLAVGDVVRLSSETHEMTVIEVAERVACAWYAGGEYKWNAFPQGALVFVRASGE